MRNAFEAGTGVVANWDVMESVLDAVFVKLGVDGRDGKIDVPIVMTETVANLGYSRKCELLLRFLLPWDFRVPFLRGNYLEEF